MKIFNFHQKCPKLVIVARGEDVETVLIVLANATIVIT
jgi:hypothetical protein